MTRPPAAKFAIAPDDGKMYRASGIRAIAAWLETPECWFRPAKS